MNMKDKIITLIIILLAAVSCVKKDEWPTAQERLSDSASLLFDSSVKASVRTIRFCSLFQEYLNAPDNEKLAEKYTSIRKNVTMIGENTYELSYGPRFTTNGIQFSEPGALVSFDKTVTVRCVAGNEWEVMATELRTHYGELISYTAAYKLLPDSDNGPVAEITAEGVLKADEYSETAGYSATFGTDTPLRLSGGSYTGTFRMTTRDASGSKLDEYVLPLGKTKQ